MRGKHTNRFGEGFVGRERCLCARKGADVGGKDSEDKASVRKMQGGCDKRKKCVMEWRILSIQGADRAVVSGRIVVSFAGRGGLYV